MADPSIIVIGASAGGVEGLVSIAAGLPADLPAIVFVTLHLAPNYTSLLPSILSRAGKLHARHPEDLEVTHEGEIYIAPPDHHLLVERGYVRISRGPKENGHRPAVDALFRTAANAYHGKVIGVILSGARDDGTAGLKIIKDRGGVAVAQDPAEALYPSMPQSAIDHVKVDHVVPVEEIPDLLIALATELSVAPDAELSRSHTPDIAEFVVPEDSPDSMPGKPSGFICPDCGGALWEMNAAGLLRFRCHVGHAWSPESLLDAELSEVEEALTTAFRALREHMTLARRVADNARKHGNITVARRFEERIVHMHARSEVIRKLLQGGENGRPDKPGDSPSEKRQPR